MDIAQKRQKKLYTSEKKPLAEMFLNTENQLVISKSIVMWFKNQVW